MVYITLHNKTMSLTPSSTLYTVAEVSALLKLSALTIYKYIKEQKLEAIDFGGHYRIEAGALERFIEQHKIKSASQEEEYEESK